MPRIVFINKMDRTGADFQRVVEEVRERLAANPLVLQVPIGAEEHFTGMVDLVTMKARVFDDPMGASYSEAEVPEDLRDEADDLREKALRHALDVR